ncbi:Crp/Fnr family transcriptional regulator [Epilithonimonas sp. JDS]|uniref:Crp/Fnr family transcriptional regulator n=1 Tax=Epilithonimonas sp. JDS TaxID=2902797 RepID=UPI001E455CED|nr:Crp/Fnr family transcriptional regulator [Epilithonimonas sp. JDS]MCD9856660.1 Crp/Fnr family transcriptional regulator [Epilithonimonas sp. JDS]
MRVVQITIKLQQKYWKDDSRAIKKTTGSETIKYCAGDIIFSVGDKPLYFFYISDGKAKLISKDGDSKDLIQEFSQGETGLAGFSLFITEPYPVTAIAVTDCLIIRIPVVDFADLIQNNEELKLYLLNNISDSLYQKFISADIQFKRSGPEKIVMLLNFLKRKHTDKTPFSFKVLLSRKDIADLTGLRVETVIRNVKKLEQQKILKIINHKIYY